MKRTAVVDASVLVQFLLVEDDDQVARAYQRALGIYGPVTIARCLADARALLLDVRLTGVVTDVSLPDGSGLDFAREARAACQHLPILIVSGSVDHERLDCSDELRAAFLQKPVSNGQLARFAERAIARQRQTAGLIAIWVTRYELSAAEAITLRLAIDGRKREAIAQSRGVSPNTVKQQITSLLRKIGKDELSTAVAAFYFELANR